MKILFYYLNIIFLLALTSCSNSNSVLTIEGGKITGVETSTDGVLIYKGIPYAAPPIGALRWREPQPVIPWEGVKVADKFGDAAVQEDQPVGGFYQHEFYQAGDPKRSEDCLYLNVWTPAAGKTSKKLPVAMYIHGGGYAHGYGNEIEFDGEAWAKRGVILVTINYRLGPLGFFSHPLLTAESPNHTSGNQGILDMIAALNWIKNNITQFGGDPDNVTVFGQSAGGAAVGYLCTSTLTVGLMSKAVIMSGGGVVDTGTIVSGANRMEDVQEATKGMYDYFGMTTLEQMRSYPAQDVFSISDKYSQAIQGLQGVTSGGAGLVSNSQSIKTLGYQSYDEIMGSRSIRAEKAAAQSSQNVTPAVQNIPSRVQSATPSVRTVGAGPIIDGYLITDTFSNAAREGKLHKLDYMIGSVANDVARLASGFDNFCLINEEMGNTTYVYEFARELPGDDAGAFHSGELWYIFKTLSRSWRPMTPADFALSEKMVDSWTNFAKTGNPNPTTNGEDVWKPFTKDNKQVYTFNIE